MHGKWKKRIQEGTGTSVGGAFYLYEKLQPVCMEIEFPKEIRKRNQTTDTKKEQEMGRSYGLLH